MRRLSLFNVLFIVVLCVVGIGFYRGWFVLSSHSDDNAGGHKVDVNLSVDQDKMKADVKAVEAKAKDLTGSAANAVPQTTKEERTETQDK